MGFVDEPLCLRSARGKLIEGVQREYNRNYGHPFEWTWTNQKMRRWSRERAR